MISSIWSTRPGSRRWWRDLPVFRGYVLLALLAFRSDCCELVGERVCICVYICVCVCVCCTSDVENCKSCFLDQRQQLRCGGGHGRRVCKSREVLCRATRRRASTRSRAGRTQPETAAATTATAATARLQGTFTSIQIRARACMCESVCVCV